MESTLSIPQASLRLGRSYNQVLRLVLRGELHGWQDAAGRWRVSGEAVEQMKESSSHPQSSALATGT